MIPLRLGMDFGTTKVALNVGGEIILREPNLVMLDRNAGKILAFGTEALEMQGKTPSNISCVRPVRDGVVANVSAAEAVMRMCFKKVTRLRRIMLTVNVPPNATPVECRALRETAILAGAHEVTLIQSPLLAAMGAGLDSKAPTGLMTCDIGGGTADAGVLSMGTLVVAESAKIAGSSIDNAIRTLLRNEYGLIAADRVLENLKVNIASALPSKFSKDMEICGNDLVTGLPHNRLIGQEALEKAIAPILQSLLDFLKGVLAKTPPELSGDILDSGLVLTGGSSLVANLDEFLKNALKIPVKVAENAADCVALGTSLVNVDKLI